MLCNSADRNKSGGPYSNIDILGLSETWLKESSPEAGVVFPDYNVFRRDRGKGKGGGVLLYVKNNLVCSQLSVPSEVKIENVSVKVSLSAEMTFTLFCVYRPPSAKVDIYEQLQELLKHHTTYNKSNEIIVIGDFNVNWDCKKDRKSLKYIMDNLNLSQLVQQPTRITKHSQ